MISSKSRLNALCGSLLALLSASSYAAGNFIIDLTHPIPTFHPMEGDPMKPDMSKPWLDSQAIPSFGQQTVLAIGQFPTNQGHFDLGTLVLSEHHGTHMDSSAHYVNNAESMEEGNPAAEQRKYMHMLDGEDLSGPIVLVDISARVQAELDKNGGTPSPDTSVTNFSDASGNAVTADDIAAVADRIDDGVWLVLSQGWSRFYFQGTDFCRGSLHQRLELPGPYPRRGRQADRGREREGRAHQRHHVRRNRRGDRAELARRGRELDELLVRPRARPAAGLEADRERQQPRPARDGVAR